MGIAERQHHVETGILEVLQVRLTLEHAEYDLAVNFGLAVKFFHKFVMNAAQVLNGMLMAETGDREQAVILQVRGQYLRIPTAARQDFEHVHIRPDPEQG